MTHPDATTGKTNTDRELWRGPDEGGGDFYADSIHVTKEGAIGINCGGYVYVKPLREWHRLAGGKEGFQRAPTGKSAGEPVAWRWRHVNDDRREWHYQEQPFSSHNEYLIVEPLFTAAAQPAAREEGKQFPPGPQGLNWEPPYSITRPERRTP